MEKRRATAVVRHLRPRFEPGESDIGIAGEQARAGYVGDGREDAGLSGDARRSWESKVTTRMTSVASVGASARLGGVRCARRRVGRTPKTMLIKCH